MRYLNRLFVAAVTLLLLTLALPARFVEAQVTNRVQNVTNLIANTATSYLTVRLTDGSSFVSLASDSVFGTATYTEATSTGPLVGGIRNDTPDSLANTTNEVTPFGFTAAGAAWVSTIDPCSSVAKTHIPIDIVTATTTELTAALAGASTNYYICSLNLVTAGANNVAIVDDDTDNCASVTSGIFGGATAAEGWNFAANGGLTLGNGNATVGKTVGTNRVICAITSAAVQLSGSMTVVAAP